MLQTERLKEEIRMLKLRFENLGKELVSNVLASEKSLRNQLMVEHAVAMTQLGEQI
jgi:hypothetical protein